MKDNLEARLARIRQTDAFLAARLELLLAVAGIITVTGLVMFLWYAIIRRHELWEIALISISLGIALGVPIGRFVMPSVVEYIRELFGRLQATQPEAAKHGGRSS